MPVSKKKPSTAQTAQALRITEREWQTSFDALSDAVFVLDAEQRVRRCNKAARRLFHKPLKDMIGRHCWEIVHGTSNPVPKCPFRKMIVSRRRETMELAIGNRWYKVAVDPLASGNGDAPGAVHILSDITDLKQAEVGLRESQRRLALAASGTRIGMFEWNVKTGKTLWTEQHARLLGLRPTTTTTTLSLEYSYRDWANRVHPEDLPRVEAALRRCMAKRVPYEAEYRVVWPDKSVHWLTGRGLCQYDTEGEPARMFGIVMDITVRKLAEETLLQLNDTLEERVAERTAALAASETKYRTLTEGLSVLVYRADPKTLAATFINRAIKDFYGYTVAEWLANPRLWQRTIHAEDRDRVVRAFTRARRENTGGFLEYRIVRKDGRVRYVLDHYDWERGPSGAVIGLSGSLTDITECKEAELLKARLAAITESSSDAITAVDLKGRFISWNKAAERLYGYTAAEAIGKPVSILIPPDRRDDFRRLLRGVRHGAGVVGYETARITKTGKRIDVAVTISPIRDAKDRIIGSSAIVRDVTDRKRATEELEKALLKATDLEAIVNRSPVMVFLWRVADGWPVDYASDNVRQLGYSARDFVSGRVSWPAITHPEDVPRLEAEVAGHLKKGTDQFVQQYRLVNKSGQTRWVQDVTRAVRDPRGNLTHFQGLVWDITERKKAEQALEESETRFRTIFDSAGDGMFLRDLNGGRFRLANKACLQMLGYSLEEFKALSLEDLHFEEDLPFIREQIDLSRKGKTGARGEVRFRRKDGTPLFTELNSTAVRLNGQDYALVVIRDIGERKRLEAEIETVGETERQRIGRELHDGLGQSLTAIGYLASAVRTELARKSVPEAADMDKLVGQIQRTLHQTHEMARGLFPDEFKSGGIIPALQELAVTTSDLCGVRCRFSGPRKIALLDARAVRELYRIAQEAVNNAVKHSRGKRIRIRLRQDGGRVTLTVRDNGIGIRTRTTRRADMGLRIMQYRADIISATLRFESARGRGTCVTCELPARRQRR